MVVMLSVLTLAAVGAGWWVWRNRKRSEEKRQQALCASARRARPATSVSQTPVSSTVWRPVTSKKSDEEALAQIVSMCDGADIGPTCSEDQITDQSAADAWEEEVGRTVVRRLR